MYRFRASFADTSARTILHVQAEYVEWIVFMSGKTDNHADKIKIESFESAMEELNRLVAQLEDGTLPLEASITAYRRGVELVRYCAAQLEKVDRQIEMLDREMLKPFQPDNTSEDK